MQLSVINQIRTLCILCIVFFSVGFSKNIKISSATKLECQNEANQSCDHNVFNLKTLQKNSKHLLQKMSLEPRRDRKKQQDLFTRFAPMLVIPYLIQSALLPGILMSLKAMLLQTFLLGKLALIFSLFNSYRSSNMGSMTDEQISKKTIHQQYGYGNAEEFGAYIN